MEASLSRSLEMWLGLDESLSLEQLGLELCLSLEQLGLLGTSDSQEQLGEQGAS